MTGQQKERAMRNMVESLYDCGYIDDKERRMLLYQIEVGDMDALYDIRRYLTNLLDELTQIVKKRNFYYMMIFVFQR